MAALSHLNGRKAVHAIFWVSRLATGTLVPVVAIADADGGSAVAWEILEYTLRLQDEGASSQVLGRAARVYGMMADYHAVQLGNPVSTIDDLVAFLGRFLKARYRGLEAPGSEEEQSVRLEWRPVRWQTMKEDMRAALGFFRHCVETYGHYPAFQARPIAAARGLSSRVARNLGMSKRDFMAHLAHRRQDDGSAARQEEIHVPGERRRHGRLRSSDNQNYFPADRVEELIRATPNIVHRMFWIAAAFGSPRACEQLNLWVEDVLPGSMRPRLFSDSPATAECLLVLADPAESTFTGSLTDHIQSRLQVLSKRGLIPRNKHHEKHGLYAGWKGVVPENTSLLVSQVYWLSPAWAAEYFRLYRELLDLRSAIPKDRSHPWLYINIGHGSDPGMGFGEPLRMSNIRKAFEAACVRIGLTPYRGNASLHKLRSLFRRLALNAGLSEEDIQHMLHHMSRGSQRAYGRADASDLFNALANDSLRLRGPMQC